MDEKRTPLDASLSRRTALGLAAGATAGMVAGRMSAQEATPGSSPAASPAADDGILRSSIEGVPDAVLKAPEPFKSYEGTPANGGTVRFGHLIYSAPATPYEDNTFWQELEKRLGLDSLEVSEIPVDSYDEKISALIAGGDMGDLIYLNAGEGGGAIINRSLGEGAFVDLTDYLTGDALQEYPNLAALPEAMWTQSAFNGRIYGVPNPIYQGSNIDFYRKDWLDKLGLPEPTNRDQLAEMFNQFRNGDPDGNGSDDTYATAFTWANTYSPMFRVPNGWRLNDDGSLTNQNETEEFIAMLDFEREIWAAGYAHPDASTNTRFELRDLTNTNRVGLVTEGFGDFWGLGGIIERLNANIPDAELKALVPFGHDGGEGYAYPLPAYYGIVSIPVTSEPDEDRIRELLRICDYLYPPFGSEEYNFHVWGIEGEHHTVDENGDRRLTDKGVQDVAQLLYGFMVEDLYIYYPGYPEHARLQQSLVEQLKPMTVMNPTSGLYSEKATRFGPVINQIMGDATSSYVLGRAERDEVEKAIERWRAEGGDEIRADYERLIKERDAASEATPPS